MKAILDSGYSVYITTNPNKTTLYIGVTNNLGARLIEHWTNRGRFETFAGRYFCINLIYFESFTYILNAISREKELKKWSRKKKETLIQTMNPQWIPLNGRFCRSWPPDKGSIRY